MLEGAPWKLLVAACWVRSRTALVRCCVLLWGPNRNDAAAMRRRHRCTQPALYPHVPTCSSRGSRMRGREGGGGGSCRTKHEPRVGGQQGVHVAQQAQQPPGRAANLAGIPVVVPHHDVPPQLQTQQAGPPRLDNTTKTRTAARKPGHEQGVMQQCSNRRCPASKGRHSCRDCTSREGQPWLNVLPPTKPHAVQRQPCKQRMHGCFGRGPCVGPCLA